MAAVLVSRTQFLASAVPLVPDHGRGHKRSRSIFSGGIQAGGKQTGRPDVRPRALGKSAAEAFKNSQRTLLIPQRAERRTIWQRTRSEETHGFNRPVLGPGAPQHYSEPIRGVRWFRPNAMLKAKGAPIQAERPFSAEIMILRALGLAFLTYYLLHVVPQFLPFLETALKTRPVTTGFLPLDLIPGVLGPFYRQICSTPSGVIAFGTLSTCSIAWGLLAGSEASRLGARGFSLTHLTVTLLLINFLAVATVVPAIWLPAYLLSRTQDSLPQRERVVAPKRTALIAAQNWITTALLLGIAVLSNQKLQNWAVLLFTLSPLYLPFMWRFVKTTAGTDESDSRWAIVAMHLMQAGISIAWHIQSLIIMVNNPGTVKKILSLVTNHSSSVADGFAFFIFADALILFAVLAYFAVRQSGFRVAAALAAATVAVGPAAALGLYFAYRELERARAW